MSDDKKTEQLEPIVKDARESAETDEFDFEHDPNEATTRRVSGSRFEARRLAAVPGHNSTMPIPAVSGSKTTSTPVPESILRRTREETSDESHDASPDDSSTAIIEHDQAETLERSGEYKRFVTLDVPLEAIGDETLTDDEMAPTVRFEAEIDREGKIFIPRKYIGLLRFGQKVTVTVQAHLDENQ